MELKTICVEHTMHNNECISISHGDDLSHGDDPFHGDDMMYQNCLKITAQLM